jgi:hypothetical protein
VVIGKPSIIDTSTARERTAAWLFGETLDNEPGNPVRHIRFVSDEDIAKVTRFAGPR